MALFGAIHSVDRPSLAEALAKEIARQGRRPLLFVEINTGAEPQKAGVLPQDADSFLAACRERYGLTIVGPDVHSAARRSAGAAFRSDREDRPAATGLKLLSMGMSADFAIGDRVRGNPCAGRDRDIRRPRGPSLKMNLIFVFWRLSTETSSRIDRTARSATQPAVGAKPGRATWMNTALPRPATRGRVLWSISIIRS